MNGLRLLLIWSLLFFTPSLCVSSFTCWLSSAQCSSRQRLSTCKLRTLLLSSCNLVWNSSRCCMMSRCRPLHSASNLELSHFSGSLPRSQADFSYKMKGIIQWYVRHSHTNASCLFTSCNCTISSLARFKLFVVNIKSSRIADTIDSAPIGRGWEKPRLSSLLRSNAYRLSKFILTQDNGDTRNSMIFLSDRMLLIDHNKQYYERYWLTERWFTKCHDNRNLIFNKHIILFNLTKSINIYLQLKWKLKKFNR